MSLVGRLEDLSLSDVLQIIFLSRRSGELSVRTPSGKHSLVFRNGLLAGGSSPDVPSLGEFLRRHHAGADADEEKITAWASSLVTPLLSASSGEFEFLLGGASASPVPGYDPSLVLGREGLEPQALLGGARLRPLANLEQRARGSSPVGLRPQAAPTGPVDTAKQREELDASGSGKYRFRVRKPSSSAAGEVQRIVVLFAPDAQLRVAVRRTLSTSAPDLRQFYSATEVTEAIHGLARDRRFFLTVLDCSTDAAAAEAILHLVRRINRRLPVVVLAGEQSSSRPGAAELQADLELFTPVGAAGQSSEAFIRAMAHLDRFVEEQFWEWERNVADFPSESSASGEFYDAELRDATNRKYDLLEALIMELSDPEDLLMIASILIRAASQYVDRGAVFSAGTGSFSRVLAFGGEDGGAAGGGRFTIDRSELSVLRDVAESVQPHRGKLRKTPANISLVESFGAGSPSDAIVVPIISGNEVVGVFYGDNAKFRQPISETSGLEIFLSQAGRAFERARGVSADRVGR